nr:MAG TPA: hypothetical protein [Caudoviricetes sp.]
MVRQPLHQPGAAPQGVGAYRRDRRVGGLSGRGGQARPERDDES